MLRWIHLLMAVLPTCSGAVELSTMLSSLKRSGIPDTSEYRLTTTFQVGGQPMSTTMKVIQSGTSLHWSEASVGGRKLRIVRNAQRQRILDVGSGESHTLVAPPRQITAGLDWNRLASATWTDPVETSPGSWRIRQTSGLDSGIAGRILDWSAQERQPRALVQWDSKGDTTRARIRWSIADGRRVPDEIQVETGRGSQSQLVTLRFTEWRFPRSIPIDLFAIP